MPKKMPSFKRSFLNGDTTKFKHLGSAKLAMPILGFMPDASRAHGNHRNVPPDPESALNDNPDQLAGQHPPPLTLVSLELGLLPPSCAFCSQFRCVPVVSVPSLSLSSHAAGYSAIELQAQSLRSILGPSSSSYQEASRKSINANIKIEIASSKGTSFIANESVGMVSPCPDGWLPGTESSASDVPLLPSLLLSLAFLPHAQHTHLTTLVSQLVSSFAPCHVTSVPGINCASALSLLRNGLGWGKKELRPTTSSPNVMQQNQGELCQHVSQFTVKNLKLLVRL
ncbi:hypothetical protein Q8A73_002398 [Channa argus]|nr:hypothetical protein Q8A73_002398 [Channa argus]